MGYTKEKRLINKIKGKSQVEKRTPIATDMFLPNHSGDHSAGNVRQTPTQDLDLVNKKYVDDQFPVTHASTTGQTTDDHHAESHTIASHNDTTATGAELETLTDTSNADALHDHTNASVTVTHASTTGQTTDDHHAQSHTVASHSDTTATGAELNTLTDDSMADTLHRHSELSASDGTPDPALQVNASGNVGVNVTPVTRLHIGPGTGVAAWFTTADGFLLDPNAGSARFALVGSARAEVILFDDGATADQGMFRFISEGEQSKFQLINDAFTNIEQQFITLNHSDGETRVGSTTNYMAVESDGDVNFVGGAGLQFGEIYVADGSTAQTIATGATYTKSTAFATNGVSNGSVTADAANDKITIGKEGMYKVNVTLNGSIDTANTRIDFAVFNDGTICDNVKGYFEFVAANRECGGSACGIIDVAENKDIDVRVRHDDGGNVDVTCVNVNLNVVQIGGT